MLELSGAGPYRSTARSVASSGFANGYFLVPPRSLVLLPVFTLVSISEGSPLLRASGCDDCEDKEWGPEGGKKENFFRMQTFFVESPEITL